MHLESLLTAEVVKVVQNIYNQPIDPKTVQFQKTKKEFEGDVTLVVFPYVKMSRKSPEETGKEIGGR
ncbi:MAG: arginine--tRNA ligase, partial [Paludibacteraceae bacterium]